MCVFFFLLNYPSATVLIPQYSYVVCHFFFYCGKINNSKNKPALHQDNRLFFFRKGVCYLKDEGPIMYENTDLQNNNNN